MTSKKGSDRDRKSEPRSWQFGFSVKPGSKLQVTIESGPPKAGRIPIDLKVDEVSGRAFPKGWFRQWKAGLASRFEVHHLGAWLFGFAIAIYLLTRLIGLDRYPIYFFTDEAIQTLSMADLMAMNYRDSSGTWLPTYFRNGEYTNLGLSVYLQWLPLLLF